MSRSGSPDGASVLVLQTGIRSGPWVCKSLARAGYRVLGGHDDAGGRYEGRSRYCRAPLRYPSPRRDASAFLRHLEQLCRRESVSVVLPLDESVVHLLAVEEPDLGSATVAGPSAHQYRMLCDKRRLSETAAAVGVGVPTGVTVVGHEERAEWPPLPNIVKPVTSATPVGRRAVYRPAALVRTNAERDAVTRRVLAETGGVVVQEFVSGRAWLVEFVRHADGNAALARLVERRQPRFTGMGSVIRVADPPLGLLSAAESLLAAVDYRGPGQIQFLERDGRFFVHDANLRVIFSIAATIGAGLDVPRLAVEQALGLPLSLPSHVKKGVRYVWLGAEARLLLEAMRGQDAGTSARRILSELLLAALLPRRILDPVSLWDPWVLRASGARAATRLLGRMAAQGHGRPHP